MLTQASACFFLIAAQIAKNLSEVSEAPPLLVKLFSLYASRTYPKSVDVWVEDVCRYLVTSFFPAYEMEIISLFVKIFHSAALR